MKWWNEFVQDRATKSPFPHAVGVATAVHEKDPSPVYCISLYPGIRTVDAVLVYHVLIAPAYNVIVNEIEIIARVTAKTVANASMELHAHCIFWARVHLRNWTLFATHTGTLSSLQFLQELCVCCVVRHVRDEENPGTENPVTEHPVTKNPVTEKL